MAFWEKWGSSSNPTKRKVMGGVRISEHDPERVVVV
jgi:hypothetical protein